MLVDNLRVAPDLCLLRPDAPDAESLLRAMAHRALAAGYVRPGFADAVVGRERAFPTGLPTPVPAAVPHTDAEHVVRPGLAVALLDPAVEFVEMASEGTLLPCRLAVMLLVTSPQDQVDVLGRVIAVLQDPRWPGVLEAATDEADLAARFTGLPG